MNYILLPRIGFSSRAILTFILFTTGLLLQWSSRNFFPGLPFILLAGAFHIQRGVTLKRPRGGRVVWRRGELRELLRIEGQLEQIKRWRGIGLETRALILIPIFFLLVFITPLFSRIATLFWDLALLFGFVFFTGNRSAWEPEGLRTKVKNLKDLINTFPWKDYPDYSYHLEVAIRRRLEGSYPIDVRLKVEKKTGPSDLIGLQGQYSINRVKGQEYPYFYVVLIAKKGFGLKEKIRGVREWTVEFEGDEEVDVCIIRQHTTKTSGYHTPPSTQVAILKSGIDAYDGIGQA